MAVACGEAGYCDPGLVYILCRSDPGIQDSIFTKYGHIVCKCCFRDVWCRIPSERSTGWYPDGKSYFKANFKCGILPHLEVCGNRNRA